MKKRPRVLRRQSRDAQKVRLGRLLTSLPKIRGKIPEEMPLHQEQLLEPNLKPHRANLRGLLLQRPRLLQKDSLRCPRKLRKSKNRLTLYIAI